MATGSLKPKDTAAERVLARLPAEHQQVMELARDGYLGIATDNWDEHAGQVLPLSLYMARQIERLGA